MGMAANDFEANKEYILSEIAAICEKYPLYR